MFPLALAADTGQSLLQDADPALYHAVRFLRAMLDAHMGDRWTEAATAAGLSAAQYASPVATAVPYDPADYMTREQFKFPLLAVYRTEDKLPWRSVQWGQADSTWQVLWCMPPLNAGQMERLAPFRRAVAAVLRDRIAMGLDPSYTPPGAEEGDSVWEAAGICDLDLGTARYGNMAGAGELFFPSVLLDITLREREMPVDGAYEEISGVDLEVNAADAATGTTVRHVSDKTITVGGIAEGEFDSGFDVGT